MGCPCNKGPLDHSIHHNLCNSNILWVNTLVIIKPIPDRLHMKHISYFIWVFQWHLQGVLGSPLLRINRHHSDFYPVYWAGCSLFLVTRDLRGTSSCSNIISLAALRLMPEAQIDPNPSLAQHQALTQHFLLFSIWLLQIMITREWYIQPVS